MTTSRFAGLDAALRAGELGRVTAVLVEQGGRHRVAVFPDLDLVVVVTSENFGRSDAHDVTRRLLVEHVLPSVA